LTISVVKQSRWYDAPRSGLKKLLRLDSDIYRPDTFIVGTGVTPLYLAARAGYADIIRKLVRAGANVNTAKDFGEQTGITALHAACAKGNRDAVLALLEANCELNPRSSDGGTPLHCACEFAHEDVVDVFAGRRRHEQGS
jgi:ankyrin repeat protein